MIRREFLGQTAALASLAGLANRAEAQYLFQEGKHFVRLPQQLPVAAPPGKIEVVEFFWYACQHCNAFEPTLDAWVKKLPADVAFRRVHVGFRPAFEPQQRLFATLEALGLVESLHRKVFHAIHQLRQRLDQPEEILDFVEKNGVDRAKFRAIYNSDDMPEKVRQGKLLAEAYKIDGVPALGVHGRYYTSPSLAGGDNTPELQRAQRALALTDQLVARIRKGT